MKKMVKVFIGLFLVFLVIMTGGLFYAKSKLASMDLKKIIVDEIHKQVPGSLSSLESVDAKVKLPLNIEINLKNFDLKLKDAHSFKKTELFKVSSVNANIPLWSMLFHTGTVHIMLDNPAVYVEQKKEELNFLKAIGSLSTTKDEQPNQGKEESQGENKSLDLILKKVSVDLRINSMLVNYNIDDNSGKAIINKILVKNLNFKSDTAFEIDTNLEIALNKKETVKSQILIVGDMNLKEIIKSKSLSGNVQITLNNDIPSLKAPVDIKTNIEYKVKAATHITLNMETIMLGDSRFKANIVMDEKKVSLSDINAKLNLTKFLSLVDTKDMPIDVSGVNFIVNGSLGMWKDLSHLQGDLSFETDKDLSFNMDDVLNGKISLKGKFKNTLASGVMNVKTMSGLIESKFAAPIDINQKPFPLVDKGLIKIKTQISNLKIPKAYISKTIYAEKKPGKETSSLEPNDLDDTEDTRLPSGVSEKSNSSDLPPTLISIRWTDVLIENEKFKGQLDIQTAGKKVVIPNGEFSFSKGRGAFSAGILLGDRTKNISFKSEINHLNLDSLAPFLPPMVGNISGDFSGSASGDLALREKGDPNYDIKVKMKGLDGSIKKINIQEYVSSIIAKVPALGIAAKNKKVNISEKFKEFIVDAKLTPAHFVFTELKYIGLGNAVEIKGQGNLFPLTDKKEGVLEFTLKDEKGSIADSLEKNIGTNIIPIRITARKLLTNVDYGYTISKLAKGAVKTQAKKAIKEQATKQLNKFIKDDGVKKLLKGFFN